MKRLLKDANWRNGLVILAGMMLAGSTACSSNMDAGGGQNSPTGTFWSPRDGVEGLTTAASLLLAAAVGICVAMSLWVAAVGTAVLALIVLRAVSSVQRWLEKRGRA